MPFSDTLLSLLGIFFPALELSIWIVVVVFTVGLTLYQQLFLPVGLTLYQQLFYKHRLDFQSCNKHASLPLYMVNITDTLLNSTDISNFDSFI